MVYNRASYDLVWDRHYPTDFVSIRVFAAAFFRRVVAVALDHDQC
jgi:hypothetical protein